ncbi:DUF3667 domain-containing protein [Flavihumibacter petaseus]|uniref:DUF3667 domain-containing protein n=1 Tax=Flavihumibacter petaseus TaxID=549295 RepID=UPI00146FCD0E|nr:DUF3667 domain-containing protein [Flavihumibacter petaseus]
MLHGFYHVEHGAIKTVKDLALHPGPSLRAFLAGKRVGWYNPFTFILVTGGISAFILAKIHWQSFLVDLGVFGSHDIDQKKWANSISHFSLRLLLSIPLYAIITRILYWKSEYNISEHLVVNTYLRGQMNVLMILGLPIDLLLQGTAFLLPFKFIFLALSVMYMGWAINGVFGHRHTIWRVVKGLLCAIIALAAEMFILNWLAQR